MGKQGSFRLRRGQFACAGELLRNYSGWARADFTACQNWMMNLWYPVNHDFLAERVLQRVSSTRR